MTRILKEPLLHFCVVGALLFVAYDLVAPAAVHADRIVVTSGQVEALQARFTRTWQRPPAAQELESLIDQQVLDEVYYREALALGIDENDAMIRRRLRQKMTFLVEDTLSLMTPTEKDLRDFYAAHPDEFRLDPSYSFTQVYVSPDRAETELAQRVAALDEALSAGRGMEGDQTLLPHEFDRVSAFEVDRSFGAGFSARLDRIEPGAWSGPLRSGLGLHFVYLRDREPGGVEPFEQVRAQVERQWAYRKRQQATEELNRRLLAKYEVVVETREAQRD
jgi:hypothetical protein